MVRIGQTIAASVVAFCLVSVLCGGTCSVSYCSEDCDPCVQQCKCRTTCQNNLSHDFTTLHRLSSYRLVVAVDGKGGLVRTFSEIVGPSLEFALGSREHSADDFSRFARGVIEVNRDLLAPRGTEWSSDPVLVFESAILVPFRRLDAEDTLTFLFDRRGNLVEIDEVRSASPADRR